MNSLILLLIVMLAVLLFFSMRTMQDEHLFAIAHRAEFCAWLMLALYLSSLQMSGQEMIAIYYDPSSGQAQPALLVAKLTIVAILTSRILAVAAFTLGNPPKVRVEVNPKAIKTAVVLTPVTSTPGVQLDSDGKVQVIL